jgi:hypothetical protein
LRLASCRAEPAVTLDSLGDYQDTLAVGLGARLTLVETPMKKVWQKPVVCMKSVSLEVTAYESAEIDGDDLN